jgi:short-subunit dehydrogenase
MTAPKDTALVTGASSGIGAECARLLAARGCDLVLVARRTEKLEELAASLRAAHGIGVDVVSHDLSVPGAADTLWTKVTGAGRRVDILINNAGVGFVGDFATSDPAGATTTLDLDVTALTLLCRHALPGMIERRHGRILNLGSLAGFQGGGPGMAVYFAAKSYVLAFTRGLARELRGSGVTVTALCPGTTATEFDNRAGATNTRLFRWFAPMTARDVAAQGIEALYAGRTLCVPGLLNKVLAIAGELPPRGISVEVNRLLLRP